MTGTYRLELLYVKDQHHVGHGRKSRSRNKPIDRRIKRREHARITREAVSSWEQDAIEDEAFERQQAQELWYAEMEEEDSWYDHLDETADDLDYYSSKYDEYYEDDYFDYGYDWYCEYESSVYREETPHDRIIKSEDCGKSLGEILQEIEDRKHG